MLRLLSRVTNLVPGGKIGPVPGYVPIYPYSCDPKDQIAAMNAEEMTEKVWCDFYAHREYSPFIEKYWERNNIDPDIRLGDMDLIKKAKIDFFALIAIVLILPSIVHQMILLKLMN